MYFEEKIKDLEYGQEKRPFDIKYSSWMNKQFHVHSVNQWVACRQESESMSSSLIDRLDTAHYRRASSVYIAHKQTKPDGAHTRGCRCVRACAKDFLPPRARARVPPQTCCAATGVTPHSYQTWYACSAPYRLSAEPTHTTTHRSNT